MSINNKFACLGNELYCDDKSVTDFDTLYTASRTEILDQIDDIDPDENKCIFSMTLGWAIGHGLDTLSAWHFLDYAKQQNRGLHQRKYF